MNSESVTIKRVRNFSFIRRLVSEITKDGKLSLKSDIKNNKIKSVNALKLR